MTYIAIYKSDFSYIEKPSIENIFSLPGDYYIFQERNMIKQVGNTYKDPFIIFNEEKKPSKLVINEVELTDIEILFTYNSHYQMTINFYDKKTNENKRLIRTGRNHTRALHQELSFIVKTMTEVPNDRSSNYFELILENNRMKNELDRLKIQLQNLKSK